NSWASAPMLLVVTALSFAASWLSPASVGDSPPAADIIARIERAIESGDIARAREDLGPALKNYPAAAGLHNLKGVVEAQGGNYSLAESAFRRAITLDARLVPAYLNLGRLYQENATRDKEAVRKGAQVYVQLLKIDPQNSEARYQGAYMLMLQG